MHKPIILFIALFVSFSTTTQAQVSLGSPKDSTFIDAYLEGIPAGITRLVGTYGDQNYLADSAQVDATGHFTLRREHPLPPGFYTFLLPSTKNFSILIDQDQKMTIRAKSPDFAGTLQVEGSVNTDLFYQSVRFQMKQEPELAKLADAFKKNLSTSPEYQEAKNKQAEILAQRKAYLDGLYKAHPTALFTKFKIAGQNPDLIDFRKPNGDLDTIRQIINFRDHFWDGVDFTDTRLLHTPVITNKLKRFIKEFTPQNPDSLIKVSDALIRKSMPYKEYFQFFANWIALQYENGKTTVMDGEAVYVHIVKNFMTKELATWSTPKDIEALQKHVWEMEASLMGRKGPDVTAMDINGQMKSIYSMTAPIVVIFMFSPDCEHCQKEAPLLEQIYQKWKGRGVDFYGIGVNTKDEEWRAFVKKSGFTFTNVFDATNRAIYAKYFVDNTPELYVLNKDRTITGKNLKAEQLETIFEREFKKMK